MFMVIPDFLTRNTIFKALIDRRFLTQNLMIFICLNSFSSDAFDTGTQRHISIISSAFLPWGFSFLTENILLQNWRTSLLSILKYFTPYQTIARNLLMTWSSVHEAKISIRAKQQNNSERDCSCFAYNNSSSFPSSGLYQALQLRRIRSPRSRRNLRWPHTSLPLRIGYHTAFQNNQLLFALCRQHDLRGIVSLWNN